MQSAPTLVIENLALARGDRTLFAAFSLRMNTGEVVHLTGRNGAGKTSLLEAIAGLRVPERGSLQAPAPEQLHWIGHKNGLHPALSAVENLEFWCGLSGVDAAAIGPTLDRLQIKAARHRPARTLSTGQKRRVALARLLLARRPWWLLDEPLAGLDVQGAALFAELVAEHRAAGGAVLLTSHQTLPEACGVIRDVSLT
ncbi:MAG: heme ABC exporter ATP-binding protein CcmA [Pseudomonadota bacterium]